jgi:hypothetical protein
LKDIFRQLGDETYEQFTNAKCSLVSHCGIYELVSQRQWQADGSSKLVFVLRHLNVSVSATAPLAIFLSLILTITFINTRMEDESGIDLWPGSSITPRYLCAILFHFLRRNSL